MLGFVRRNINVSNPQIKERAYKTLEYCSTVWDPHTSTATKKSNLSNVEQLVQH